MKQNKLLILSLLASFLLLISASYATAQNAVTFGTVDDCPKPAGTFVDVPIMVDNDVDLAALDIIGQVVSVGDVDLVVTGVTFDNRMSSIQVLDERFPIGDLGLLDGMFRLGAVKLDEANLIAGNGQIVTLELMYLSDCMLGTATLDPGTALSNGGTTTMSTSFADAGANLIMPTVNSGAVNVVNALPSFTFCPDDYVVYWGDNIIVTLTAEDPDLACGCDALTFSLEPGSPGSIDQFTGLYQFGTTGSDVGCHTVVVKVADEYGGEAFCEFDIDVLNMKPDFSDCPDCETTFVYTWGLTVEIQLEAIDPDGGPSSLDYDLLNPGSYPGSPMVDNDGLFTWETEETPAFMGDFEFIVVVNDGANLDECNTENADTCIFNVTLDPKFRVSIDKTHGTFQGTYVEVGVSLDETYQSIPMGGYDFLIGYDASGLTFVEADPGGMLDNCFWEYFTYRYGADGNCGNACPSGLLRLVALAETNNGASHPTFFTNAECGSSELAVLKFYVTNDRTFECMYLPIYFYWMDCGDNAISSVGGDTLFLEDRVFGFESFEGPEHDITDHTFGLPGMLGVPDDPCLLGGGDGKPEPLRFVDFRNGGVDIACADSIDARGDINLNGVPNEIADAVMFTNYFINGLSAFPENTVELPNQREGAIAASDVNADGIALSVADLVYLIRIIQGDASPYPKTDPGAESITIKTQMIDNRMNVAYSSSMDMGAVFMRFEIGGSVESVTLGDGAGQMDVLYSVSGNELNVLVYSMSSAAIEAGNNNLISIVADGNVALTETDASDFYGTMLSTSATRLPSKFALDQNYPNPFNPQTTIALDLPVATDYSVAIYNIAGQLIRTYSGHSEAGVVSVVWDGKDASGNQVASGIYFYKALADQFTATKKMILMK